MARRKFSALFFCLAFGLSSAALAAETKTSTVVAIIIGDGAPVEKSAGEALGLTSATTGFGPALTVNAFMFDLNGHGHVLNAPMAFGVSYKFNAGGNERFPMAVSALLAPTINLDTVKQSDFTFLAHATLFKGFGVSLAYRFLRVGDGPDTGGLRPNADNILVGIGYDVWNEVIAPAILARRIAAARREE